MKCLKLKSSYVLTMKNQKGQVGIFVALIFQVIFVFFAMLINVGLVVHHKINLQQSTDLAAYYGAMKQAEILNAMAHVNFQIRQAWKLLAWRYRILGTFGMEKANRGVTAPATIPEVEVEYPIVWDTAKKPKYNVSSENFKCPARYPKASGLVVADTPFMCMGHAAFGDWISPNTGTETFCKMDCGHMDGASTTINKIMGVGSFSFQAANVGAAVNAAINKTNDTIDNICTKLAPISMQMLSLFYSNYVVDTANKSQFVKLLAKNLSLSEKDMLDLEGQKIFDGAKKTFENNLTEANKTGTKLFQTYNGSIATQDDMIKQITFQYLQFFVVKCTKSANGSRAINLMNLYTDGVFDPGLKAQAQEYNPGLEVSLEKIFNLNNEANNTIGFEKNPWVQVYYGAKATAEPKIPFLPIAKIKLHALAFAKPFGGSMGPWYVKTWSDPGKPSFDGDSNYDHRVDINLPRIKVANNDATLETLKGSRDITVNYSNYVGDTYSNAAGDGLKGGLSNIHLVATYNSMLANKFVPNVPSESSKNKTEEGPKIKTYQKPDVWPMYAEWLHLAKDVTDPDFDPMAHVTNGAIVKNSYMRDIEMTVVAPNQFDLTYYSIDPNFYQTYFADRLGKNNAFQNIKTATGMTTPDIQFPKDFGYNQKLITNGDISQDFSVRHQLQVVNDIFKNQKAAILGINPPNINDTGNDGKSYFFTFIPKFQSSLLTSWTFNDFKDFNSFPSPDNDKKKYTMQFGTCANEWSASAGGGATPVYGAPDSGKPAVPGNCVTGGRVGYSVKLISVDMVRPGVNFTGLGGPGTSGPIKNPVDPAFLNF